MLSGYGPLLMQGFSLTIGLALTAYALALVLGLIAAWARLSGIWILDRLAAAYMVVIRGIPELVLILLIYYGMPTLIQRAVRTIEGYERFRLDLDPFVSGMITLGLIYGAFAAEVFRGAILAIPRGQIDAARAFGMHGLVMLRLVVLPQMLRFAIAGLGNVWLVLVKATALVSVIQLTELMRVSQLAATATREPFKFFLIAAVLYLLITIVSLWVIRLGERHAFRGETPVRP